MVFRRLRARADFWRYKFAQADQVVQILREQTEEQEKIIKELQEDVIWQGKVVSSLRNAVESLKNAAK